MTTATKTIRERLAELLDANRQLQQEWWDSLTPSERQAALDGAQREYGVTSEWLAWTWWQKFGEGARIEADENNESKKGE